MKRNEDKRKGKPEAQKATGGDDTRRALRESEERYRLLADNVTDVIWSTDLDLQFTHFSPSVERIRGYSVEESLAQTVQEILTPASYDLAMKVLSEELARETSEETDRYRTRTMELEVTCKDGSTIWTESRTNILFDADRKPIGIMGVTRDITERKRVENALRESEEKYRSIFESIQDVYAEVSAEDGSILEISPSIEKVGGYKREEMLGKPMADFYAQRGARETLLRELAAGGSVSDYPVDLINKEGRAVPCSLSVRLLTDQDGRPVKTVGTMRDVTARKRAEEALERLNLELERRVDQRTAELSRANELLRREITERMQAEEEREKLQKRLIQAQKMEAVGTLAGGIAHDFNNLLQAVQGYAGLLMLDKNETDPGYRELREICRAVERGGELSRRLLTFSRSVESKKLPLDMNLEVRQARELLERVIPKMIEIKIHLAPDLEIIAADPTQIEQILMNLGVNARDAMPAGGKLTITTQNVTLDEGFANARPEAAPGKYVLLAVSDTGQGMDKETLEHIYEPFYTTKEVGHGTGLGLAMVYGILKNHNGMIECHSAPGEGTTFKLYFPAIARGSGVVETSEAGAIGRGKETILLVEDEDSVRDTGEAALAHFGYSVMTAADGESALKLYRDKRDQIDLVILDLIMPGMGGKRCLQEILTLNPRARVVVASGLSEADCREETIEAGASDFIDKPFDIAQLLSVVRKVLDQD
jgi:PAS domain S-box-containing protein